MSSENKYYLEKGAHIFYEADIQEFLAKDLTVLGLGALKIIGVEYPIDFPETESVGRIDILAQSEEERTLYVIEIKRGVANREAYEQIKRYITRIKELHLDKRIIGVLVASALDDETEILLKSSNIDFCEVLYSAEINEVSGLTSQVVDTNLLANTEPNPVSVFHTPKEPRIQITPKEPRIQIRYRNGEKVIIKDSDRHVSFDWLGQQRPASITPQLRKPKIEIRYVKDLKYVNGVLYCDEGASELKSVLFNKFNPPIEPEPRAYASPEGRAPSPLVKLDSQYSPLPSSETGWVRYCWGCHSRTKKYLFHGRRWCVECRTICDI